MFLVGSVWVAASVIVILSYVIAFFKWMLKGEKIDIHDTQETLSAPYLAIIDKITELLTK